MTEPVPAAVVAAIRARVTDWTPDDATLMTQLNALQVPNPVQPQPTVAPPIYESELLALLTDPANGSLGRLLSWVNFGLLKADIEAQNAAGILLWAQVLPGLGLITAAEASAIAAKASTPIPDPTWTATVPWALTVIGRDLTTDDVAAARAAAGGS